MFTFTKSIVDEFKELTKANKPQSTPAPFNSKPSTFKRPNTEGTEMHYIGNNDKEVVSNVYRALAQALEKGDVKEIEAWLLAGGSFNQTIPAPYAPTITINEDEHELDGGSLLHIAAYLGKDNIINLLMRNGALGVINQPQLTGSQEGVTPLYAASLAGHLTTVNLLINDADVHQLQGTGAYEGENALYGAVWEGQTEVVNVLLKQPGVNVNHPLTSGEQKEKTLLQLAVKFKFDSTVEILLAHGANPNQEVFGRTPLYYAARTGHVQIAKRLIERGAVVNKRVTSEEKTALHAAVAYGHKDMVHLLTENGADIFDSKLDRIPNDEKTKDGLNALNSLRIVISEMARKIESIKLDTMTPKEATDWTHEKSVNQTKLKLKVLKYWGTFVNLKRPIAEICHHIAKTNLSDEAIEKAVKTLLNDEPGKPILRMAEIVSARAVTQSATTAAPPAAPISQDQGRETARATL